MPAISDFTIRAATTTITIANGASLSAAVDLAGATLVAVQMPAAWTTANLTFQASADGATYNDVYDASGSEYTVTAAASRFIQVNPAALQGMRFVKARSGATGAPVNQLADRTLTLVAKPV